MDKIKLNNSDIYVFYPSVNYWVDRLKNNSYFSYSKLCHAFWNVAVGMDRQLKMFKKIHNENFINECIGMLCEIPVDGNYFQGISICESNCEHQSIDEMCNAVKNHLHNKELYYGLIWKKYCLNGVVKNFIYEVRNKHVVFVGMPHIANVPLTWGLDNYEFLSVNILDATEKRYEILNILKNKKNSVIIFQCGEMLSFWLINKLHELKSDNFLIDMGRSLDVFCNMDNVGEDTLKFFPNVAKPYWSRQSDNFNKFNSYEKIIVPYNNNYFQNILIKKIKIATGFDVVENDTDNTKVIIKLREGEKITRYTPLTCYALTYKCDDFFLMPKFECLFDINKTIKL